MADEPDALQVGCCQGWIEPGMGSLILWLQVLPPAQVNLGPGVGVVQVLHARLGDLFELREEPGGHVMEALDEHRLWEVCRVGCYGWHGDADFGHLTAIW